MNVLGNVKADSLDKIFIEWCNYIVNNQIKDKTIAIDGKTICLTVNMSCYENKVKWLNLHCFGAVKENVKQRGRKV